MKPAPFDYHSPTSLTEAVTLLADLGDEAKVLAGGQSLVPLMALRLAVFDHLVDLGRIAELHGIERRDGSLWVGAGTTQAAVEASTEVRDSVPLLWRATPLIGHFQIRNRGTVGGSLAHADPAAEYPAVALALDAGIDTVSPRGTRTVAAADFFTGTWTTSLADDEIVAGVSFPIWTGRVGFAIDELARRHGDFAVAGAVVGVGLDERDAVVRAAIGLIGMGSTPVRASATEADVVAGRLDPSDEVEIGRRAVADLDAVPSDLHGSDSYRRRVGAAMVARAWRRALEEARDV